MPGHHRVHTDLEGLPGSNRIGHLQVDVDIDNFDLLACHVAPVESGMPTQSEFIQTRLVTGAAIHRICITNGMRIAPGRVAQGTIGLFHPDQDQVVKRVPVIIGNFHRNPRAHGCGRGGSKIAIRIGQHQIVIMRFLREKCFKSLKAPIIHRFPGRGLVAEFAGRFRFLPGLRGCRLGSRLH